MLLVKMECKVREVGRVWSWCCWEKAAGACCGLWARAAGTAEEMSGGGADARLPVDLISG